MSRYHAFFLFGVGLIGGAMVGWLLKFPPIDSSTAAAWVQGVGSILAVGIAIWVPSRQRQLEQKARVTEIEENRRAANQRFIALIEDTLTLLKTSSSALEKSGANPPGTTADLVDREATASIYSRAAALERDLVDVDQLKKLSLLRHQLSLASDLLRPSPGYNKIYGEAAVKKLRDFIDAIPKTP